MAVLVQPHRWNRDTRLHIPHERRPLKYTAGGGFQPGRNQQNPGYPLRDAREKVQPHHGDVCGDGGFGAGLAPRWRASFATARGRIARSLGSALNVVVFGLCWSFEWHRYDFAVRCNHHGKVREPQLGRIVNNESYA